MCRSSPLASRELGKPRAIDELTHVQDLLPSILDLIRSDAGKDVYFDGMSLAPLLRGRSHLADRSDDIH